jgi:hypothetical protein
MTEAEWEACTDPRKMLDHLCDAGLPLRGLLSERKLRLFAVASCRRIWFWLEDEQNQRALQVQERLAEEAHPVRLTSREKLQVWSAWSDGTSLGAEVTWEWTGYSFASAAIAAVQLAAGTTEVRDQAALFRDVFGNLFRATLDFFWPPLPGVRPVSIAPACLTPTVVSLAQAAYDERLLPSAELDAARLGVLADALEEAAASGELVGHFRGPGLHVRGCWALDLILDKN